MKVMISDPILGSRYWIWTVYAAGRDFNPSNSGEVKTILSLNQPLLAIGLFVRFGFTTVQL